MPATKLFAPRQFDLSSALLFVDQIATLPDSLEYEIDFSKVGLVEPFPMLLIASELRKLNQREPEPSINCSGFEHMTYAAHMGFFKCFGLAHGNAPGQAKGSSRYLPITVFETEQVEREAATRPNAIDAVYALRSRRAASVSRLAHF